MTRKEEITKTYLIGTYDQQLSKKEYIRDEDIDPIISEGVKEIMSQIGKNYKNFLIEKYFDTEDNLIVYITEEYYMELVSTTINKNFQKIRLNTQIKSVANLNDRLNKK